MVSKPEAEGPSLFAALGSLFGGGPKIVRPAFSAYGKLPIYKDFLRHGLAARESQAFRQWLDRGFSRHWEANDACREHRIEPHALSLGFEGLARRVVGFLWESHDEGELRRFPFTLFVSIPASGAFGDLAALEALGEVAEGAGALRRAVREAGDAQAFYRSMRDASLTLRIERDSGVRERLAKALADLSVGEFAASLYGDAAPGRWPALLAYLARRRAAPPLACRLPVSRLLPVLRQAELWAALLLGAGAKGRGSLNLLLPWGSDASGGIVLFERALRPEDVLALHPDPAGYDRLEDLRHRVPGAAEAGAAPPPEAWGQPLARLLEPGAVQAAGG
jgi:type VI secretion system ImpM family protein